MVLIHLDSDDGNKIAQEAREHSRNVDCDRERLVWRLYHVVVRCVEQVEHRRLASKELELSKAREDSRLFRCGGMEGI